MPRARAILVLAALVAALLVTSSPASAAPHPLFDDRGTLDWYRTLPEALAVARASGKLVFIESGRRECGQCRTLVERTIPQEPIRSRLAAIAVGLADDCDVQGSPAGLLLNRNLPGASFLPLVGFATPDGRWVTGWFGSSTPAQVLAHLAIAERACQGLRAARAAEEAPPAPPVVRSAPRPAAPVVATPPRPAPAPIARISPTAPSAPVAPPPAPRVAPAPVPRGVPTPLAVLPRPAPCAPRAPAATAPPAGPSLPSLARAPANPTRASGSATGNDPVTRARIASESGDWGTVLRIWEESGNSRDASLLADLSPYAERGHLWCLSQMDDAEQAARDRRYDEALRSLGLVRRTLDGTTCPIAVDAERGERAVEKLMAIEQGSPDQADAPEALRRRAYQEFRGTRWAPLFRSRS